MCVNKRIGIIGCGLIADTHVEAIRASVPEAEIYVADPLPGKADLLRRKYNLKASFEDTSTMLSKVRPFSVHVLTPPALHVTHVRQCLEAGANVLVEKPLCFSVEEARLLYEIADAAGVVLCVDHSALFQPAVLRLRRLLKDSNGVEPIHIDSFYGLDPDDSIEQKIPLTHWKRTIPGGMLMDTVVHPVSLAVALGGPAEFLSATTLRNGGAEQLKVMWKTKKSLVCITVSQGVQPFRRVTCVMTHKFTCIVDHAVDALIFQGSGFGPRGFKKLFNNLNLAVQLTLGTVNTAWKFTRGKIQQNPGARGLIGAFYAYLAGKTENPVPPDSVLDTTSVLERIVKIIESNEKRCVSAPSLNHNYVEVKRPASTVLVTGASGFLGRALCRRLIETHRFKVIAQVRRGVNAELLPTDPFIEKRYLDFDYFTAGDFNILVEGVDTVVHCAHASGAKTWLDYERRNVRHTLELYKAAAATGCKRFIHISSVAVYGVKARGCVRLDESARFAKSGRWELYIRSKRLAEELLLAQAAVGGPQLLILRPGILYSADGERLFSKSIPTRNGRVFLLIGSGRNHLPYTRVDIVAELISRVLEQDSFPTGVYNLTGAQTESVQEFLARRCQKLGVQYKFLHLPAWLLWCAGLALETLYSLMGQERMPRITRYVVNSATRDLKYDSTKAQRELGWDPHRAIAP